MSIDFEVLQEETIQSQYSSSPHIKALAASFQKCIDPTADIDLFYKKIIDIDTAEGWGLDNWGRILGIARGVSYSDGQFFGFADSELHPFDNAPFYDDYYSTAGTYQMPDNVYRKMLYFKAMANIATSDCATLNKLLNMIFTDNTVYVKEVSPMVVQLVFKNSIGAEERAILETYGLFALGAGVQWSWTSLSESEETTDDE